MNKSQFFIFLILILLLFIIFVSQILNFPFIDDEQEKKFSKIFSVAGLIITLKLAAFVGYLKYYYVKEYSTNHHRVKKILPFHYSPLASCAHATARDYLETFPGVDNT